MALVPLVACRAKTAAGEIEATWAGSADSHGRFRSAATASWCDSLRMLELTGVKGDTGLALAVYPESAVTAGAYPARDPLKPDSARPGVAAAARWFTQTAISAFRSDSGGLDLTSGTGAVSGEFGFRMMSPQGNDTVRLQGRFVQVSVSRGGPGCPTGSVSDSGSPD